MNSIWFPYQNICKEIGVYTYGITETQTDHIIFERRRASNIFDVRSYFRHNSNETIGLTANAQKEVNTVEKSNWFLKYVLIWINQIVARKKTRICFSLLECIQTDKEYLQIECRTKKEQYDKLRRKHVYSLIIITVILQEFKTFFFHH